MGADPNAVCTLRTCGGDECTSCELPRIVHIVEGRGMHSDVALEALLDAGADSRALVDSRRTPLRYLNSALAATLNAPAGSEYAEERRAEEVRMATLLLAEACWKRDMRPSDEVPLSLIDPT